MIISYNIIMIANLMIPIAYLLYYTTSVYYPLVISHSHGKWPIEIDGLPMKNGDFPWRTVSHNQMVTSIHHQQLTSHRPRWANPGSITPKSGGRNRETPRPAAAWLFFGNSSMTGWFWKEKRRTCPGLAGKALEQELQVFFGKLGSNTMDFLKMNV